MSIPERLRVPPVSEAEMREFTELCNAIEDGYSARRDVEPLLTRWNQRAVRPYKAVEFATYYGAIDTEDFVKSALLPAPPWVDELTYDDLKAVLSAVMAAELPVAEQDYYLWWLEENLPGSNLSDLIYWPNHWFRDAKQPHIELSADQILRYALLKCGRVIPGAPEEVALPLPLPGA